MRVWLQYLASFLLTVTGILSITQNDALAAFLCGGAAALFFCNGMDAR